MIVELAAAPSVLETAEAPSVTIEDRLYARAFAVTVRGGSTEDAVDELLELASGNAHLLGRVRERLYLLAKDVRGGAHADRAVALATYAWLRAIADA